MKFSLVAITTALLVPFSSAAAVGGSVTLSYDPVYDNPNLDLNRVSCSDGPNGLVTKGYRTAGSLPNYPYIGGVFTISWNSPNCGKCYKVNYNGKSIHITGVDHTDNGFNVAKRAMDDLTNGQAEHLGRIQVYYEDAPPSACKM
ncbi:hypothetical protein PRK78_003590 [Emydomyces testavorans]|uniref:Uncharacterized protein n=1 Tax=Emydomyces testavorans TaxID=2070801 RepID=A0AAF0III0_9EURO|nr:hypothetical protein PRK78_003590 [Emydomyces testavorans]